MAENNIERNSLIASGVASAYHLGMTGAFQACINGASKAIKGDGWRRGTQGPLYLCQLLFKNTKEYSKEFYDETDTVRKNSNNVRHVDSLPIAQKFRNKNLLIAAGLFISGTILAYGAQKAWAWFWA